MEAPEMKLLMAIVSIPVLLFVCGVAPRASTTLKGEYFGQPKPGPKAEPLTVPVLASRPDHYIRAVTFSPDGNEAYWPRTGMSCSSCPDARGKRAAR
jgi:hypothetical protein